ncbi:MAG: relaxase/mobilization nuclease domain-containing protein [Lawsonibacter sp.]|nr:relaxase/mobilization nuclease domain-containing protein [Lawsonibacter sp.]
MDEIAIISFTNYPKGQNRPCMAAVMEYAKRGEKTLWQGQSLVSGINCSPESVYDDFLSTKLLYHKDDKTLFFHMVQSFPKGADVDPVTAHAAAMELAKYFEGREVLVCTHTDCGHVHSHFIINSVSLEDGRKLHISEPELITLRQRNDQVCEMFGLPVFQKGQKKKKVKSTAEYHAAARGESWKFRLINDIDECMRYAGTRDEFITLMRTEGYDVRWEASRKNITYTLPGGMKCRDDRLHNERYLKEAMEREFRIRAGIVHGGIEAAELPAEFTDTANAGTTAAGAASDTGRMDRTDEYAGLAGAPRGRADGPRAGAFPVAEDVPDWGADRGAGAGCVGSAGADATGWEAERAAYFSPTSAPAATQLSVAVDSGNLVGALGNVAQLGHSLERAQADVPVKDVTTMNPYTDRKIFTKEREKKIALGHKADDHEDEQTWQQTLG